MVIINATNPDPSVFYTDGWRSYTLQNGTNVTNTTEPGSSVSLSFYGTECRVYGKYKKGNSKFDVTVNDEPYTDGVIEWANLSNGQAFLSINDLDGPQENKVNLTYKYGTLEISRFEWGDPRVEQGQWISRLSDSGNWYNISQNNDFNQTNTPSANVTFSFKGTGIVVEGALPEEGGKFRVILDGETLEDRNVPVTQNLVVLYRNHNLTNSNHAVVLVNDGPVLRVGRAQIFVPLPETTTVPPETSTSSMPTGTESPVPPPSNGLGKGGYVGIAIAALVCAGIALLVFWFVIRRRRGSGNAYEQNQVLYVRVCSKCREDIIGDYRLECVEWPRLPSQR
ncbi:transmembrane protein [Ceratobasidium sp. AG-Ba]|nr:transmembrane protein [Ceratobasidium sp. AG-Ba]